MIGEDGDGLVSRRPQAAGCVTGKGDHHVLAGRGKSVSVELREEPVHGSIAEVFPGERGISCRRAGRSRR